MRFKIIVITFVLLIMLGFFVSCSSQKPEQQKEGTVNEIIAVNSDDSSSVKIKSEGENKSNYRVDPKKQMEEMEKGYDKSLPPLQSLPEKSSDVSKSYEKSENEIIYEEKIYKPNVVYIDSKPSHAPFHKLDNLLPGKITYIVPDTMTEQQTYTIVMTLSYGRSDKELTLNIEKQFKNSNGENLSTTTTIEKIKLGKDMKATLTSSSDQIKIVSRGSDTKALTLSEDDMEEKWMWYVTPLSEGRYDLSLNVEVVITVDGVEKQTNLNVFEKKISILAIKRSFFEKIGILIKEHIEWIISTFLLPPAYWIGRKVWRGRKG